LDKKPFYLHVKSDHPNTTKRSIPYGLGVRARHICSSEKAYKDNKKKVWNICTRGATKRQKHGR
jgi:hypothetical protein